MKESWWAAPVVLPMPRFPSLVLGEAQRWMGRVGTEIPCSFEDSSYVALIKDFAVDTAGKYAMKLEIDFPEGEHLPSWLSEPDIWWKYEVGEGEKLSLIYSRRGWPRF